MSQWVRFENMLVTYCTPRH